MPSACYMVFADKQILCSQIRIWNLLMMLWKTSDRIGGAEKRVEFSAENNEEEEEKEGEKEEGE